MTSVGHPGFSTILTDLTRSFTTIPSCLCLFLGMHPPPRPQPICTGDRPLVSPAPRPHRKARSQRFWCALDCGMWMSSTLKASARLNSEVILVSDLTKDGVLPVQRLNA